MSEIKPIFSSITTRQSTGGVPDDSVTRCDNVTVNQNVVKSQGKHLLEWPCVAAVRAYLGSAIACGAQQGGKSRPCRVNYNHKSLTDAADRKETLAL